MAKIQIKKKKYSSFKKLSQKLNADFTNGVCIIVNELLEIRNVLTILHN